jgi:alanine racemase
MSHLDTDKAANHERQISLFRDLRRAYSGMRASLANSSGIFLGGKAHFDLVRAGSALYGVNPTPNLPNPMLPVIELKARIVQVRNLDIAGRIGIARRHRRLAFISMGYADGYPCASANKLQCWSAATAAQLLGIRPWIYCRSMSAICQTPGPRGMGKW